MNVTTNVFVFFLLSISLSLILFSYLADPRKTGAGFFKLIFTVSAVGYLLCFLSLILSPLQTLFLPISFLGLSITTFCLKTLQKETRIIKNEVLQVLIIIVSFFIGYFVLDQNIHVSILSISSLMFVGIITYSMLMGHWYLVTPKLSEQPLINATYITWVLLFLKFFTSLYFYFHYFEFFKPGSLLGGGYLFNWILLIMRYVWGYLIILVMSILSYKLIKMRSLQSATGILYAETFFIFVGELISMYFYLSYGVFL